MCGFRPVFCFSYSIVCLSSSIRAQPCAILATSYNLRILHLFEPSREALFMRVPRGSKTWIWHRRAGFWAAWRAFLGGARQVCGKIRRQRRSTARALSNLLRPSSGQNAEPNRHTGNQALIVARCARGRAHSRAGAPVPGRSGLRTPADLRLVPGGRSFAIAAAPENAKSGI